MPWKAKEFALHGLGHSCVAFAINPNFGVQFYDMGCYDHEGQLDDHSGWITYVNVERRATQMET